MDRQPLIPRWAYQKGRQQSCVDYYLWWGLQTLHLEDLGYLELLHLKDRIDKERTKLMAREEAEPLVSRLDQVAGDIAYWLDLQEAR
jgi:hypothetical protein